MAYHRYAFLAGKTENQKGNCEMKVTSDLTEPMIPDKAAQTLIPAGEI